MIIWVQISKVFLKAAVGNASPLPNRSRYQKENHDAPFHSSISLNHPATSAALSPGGPDLRESVVTTRVRCHPHAGTRPLYHTGGGPLGPSAYNIQPWRFIYAMRDDAHWDAFLDLLDPFNASWAQNASALVFLVSDTLTPAHGSSPARLSRTHSFDAGAAWAHLALQATALGYQAHAMAGIHFAIVRQRLLVPDHYRVEIAIAIGRQTDPFGLPKALQEREKPSLRLALEEIAFPECFVRDPIAMGSAPTGSSRGGE